MFFNITHENQEGLVDFVMYSLRTAMICHTLCPPTRPRNRIHIASYGSLRACKDTTVKVLISRELPIKMTPDRVWG